MHKGKMERLTRIDGIGQNEIIKCFGCGLETAGAELEHCGYCEHWQTILDRLAAYEDTGLTPEEVSALREQLTRITAERDQMAGWVECLCDVDVPEDPEMVKGALMALREIGWRGPQKEE